MLAARTDWTLLAAAQVDAFGVPNPLVDSMRVLSFQLNAFFTLDAHYQSLVPKSQLLQGILSWAVH